MGRCVADNEPPRVVQRLLWVIQQISLTCGKRLHVATIT